LLFLFTGYLKRRPDNGRQAPPNFSHREFSIVRMILPEREQAKTEKEMI
jgi:hypothetical protein